MQDGQQRQARDPPGGAGQHSWRKALLNTVSGSYGNAQFRFVARPPGQDDPAKTRVAGATFSVMRFQDLDNLTEPHAWLEIAAIG